MMRVGLLTLPLKHNYGGIIQITALNHYLRSEEGAETIHLNKKYNVSRFKVLARNILKFNPFYRIYDFNGHARNHHYIVKLRDFVKKELNVSTKSIYTGNELKRIVDDLKLDVVIVGSDQVWRMLYIKENYKDYFLSFVDSEATRKIAYAASFGKDEWEQEDVIPDVKLLLKDFHAISVREDSGVKLCRKTFDVNEVDHILDPTFLPSMAYYESIIKEDYNEEKTIGLFNYVLDKTEMKNKIINDIANEFNFNINTIYLDNSAQNSKKNKSLKPSMGEWLYHFKNADFIITDSFHGTIFSIIFNKQFITIGNKDRGVTRFTSLLRSLGLMNRFILEDSENYKDIITTKIDYNVINQRLKKLKIESKSFLKRALLVNDN